MYIDYLPYHVIECPSIGTVDICSFYTKHLVQITDAWGKTWYLQSIGRNHYDWTRSRLSARCFTQKTAQKYADIVSSIWNQYANEHEND